MARETEIIYHGRNQEKIQELKDFCDIGDYFNYMGYDMWVIKHYTVDYSYNVNRNHSGLLEKDYSKEIRFPLLQTEFVNPVTGSFEKRDFNYSHLEILRKQNIK